VGNGDIGISPLASFMSDFTATEAMVNYNRFRQKWFIPSKGHHNCSGLENTLNSHFTLKIIGISIPSKIYFPFFEPTAYLPICLLPY